MSLFWVKEIHLESVCDSDGIGLYVQWSIITNDDDDDDGGGSGR